VIFKRKTVPKEKNGQVFPPGIIVRAQQSGWMTQEWMVNWVQKVWGTRPCALLEVSSMLALDAFRGHLTPDIKSELVKQKIDGCDPCYHKVGAAAL